MSDNTLPKGTDRILLTSIYIYFTYVTFRRNERNKVTVWMGICGNGSILGPFFFDRNVDGNAYPVSSIYIWSKNFSHSAYVKSEAKDGGH